MERENLCSLKLKRCRECLKVLGEIIRSRLGASPYDIHKKTTIPYVTINRCVKILKREGLVSYEVQPSSKGGIRHIYKATGYAESVYSQTKDEILSNGEALLRDHAMKVAKGIPDVKAEDLLRKVLDRIEHGGPKKIRR